MVDFLLPQRTLDVSIQFGVFSYIIRPALINVKIRTKGGKPRQVVQVRGGVRGTTKRRHMDGHNRYMVDSDRMTSIWPQSH